MVKKKKNKLDQRRAPRLKTEVTVQYTIKQKPAEERDKISLHPPGDITRTKDISEKGVFFTASWVISPQTILGIKLRVPKQEVYVDLEGQVVACETIVADLIYGIRVAFVNMDKEQEKALRNLIRSIKG